MARAEKRPVVDDEARGEPAFPTGPSPPPPPPPQQQRTTPTTAPLYDPLQTRMGPDIGRPTAVGSGHTAGGSGPIGLESVPVGTGPRMPSYEVGEGSNRSVEARNPGSWQYKKFVKNGG